MKKHRIIYLMGLMLILSLLMSGMMPKEKKDIKEYLGKPIDLLIKDNHEAIKKNSIKLKQNEEHDISEITLLSENYHINNISVGDQLEKIYAVYPNEWLIKDKNHIWIGIGGENHYGIVTEYIVFILDNQEIIQEIRFGYTAQFSKIQLPASNDKVWELLQGEWQSNHDRVLIFNKDTLQDNLMDELWNQQSYQIIAPNKMFVTRVKENQKEKVTLNFWITEDIMYMFAIDEHNVPIEKTIEVFLRIN